MGGKLIRLRISLVALALIKEKAFNKIRSNKTKLRLLYHKDEAPRRLGLKECNARTTITEKNKAHR